MQENERLIKRAQNGNSDAFEELVSPYESRIYAICLRIMGNREDALDCAQDAMLRIFRALGEYRYQAAFTTWLFRITTNVCLDALRRQKVRPSTSLDALMDEGYSPPDPKASPE
ncbi:MAG TPA: sigma-70 family RNA polymerase sigma factor, partial [Clostridia bacterium]|nr:sigma-70 family RNA polymerase sigma factor [Clostridia bacterium]